MILTLEACEVDLVRGRVLRDGSSVALTAREAALLAYLAARPLQAVSRDVLLSEVWGYADTVVSRACDSTVARLREKVEADPRRPRHLLTAHGTGYRFVPDDVVVEVAPTELPAVSLAVILGERTVDLGRAQVTGPAGVVALSAGEGVVLERLIAARGAAVERGALQRATGSAGGRAIDNLILRLRRKVEPDPSEPRFLVTTPGGYRLEVPVAPSAALPAPDPLLGRGLLSAEITRASELHPYVALVGPAGVGKTSLARAWASANGALWVDNRAAGGADDVAEQVARALGLEVGGEDCSRQVVGALRSGGARRVVLDNLDGAADTVGPLIELWTGSLPEVRWLSTTRIRTGVGGEAVIEVPPLQVDDGVTLLRRAPAIRDADPELLRAMVRRVDGLPLALELAAGRCAVLGPAAVLARMDLDLLADPRAAGPHASLRDALGWSFALLDDAEVEAVLVLALLRRFDIADAEALLGPTAIDRVQALRDHSLIRAEPVTATDPTLRLACWEVVREYAADLRARQPDRGRAVAERVVRYLARWGEDADEWEDPDPARDAAIAGQLDDLRRAVGLAATYDLPEGGRCAIAAAGWYASHGPYAAGLALLSAALALPSLSRADRAICRYLHGSIEHDASRFEEAEATLTIAVQDAREADLPWVEARSLKGMAQRAQLAGRPQEGAGLMARAADAAERANEPGLAAWLRGSAAMYLERYDDARAEIERCRRAFPPDHVMGAYNATWMLGRLASLQGRLSVALVQYRRCCAWADEAERPSSWMTAAGAMLFVAATLGDDSTEAVSARIVELALHHDSAYDEAQARMCLGSYHLFGGRPAEASDALARARSALERVSAPPMALAFVEMREAEVALAEGRAAVALAGADEVHRLGVAVGNRSATTYGSQLAALAELALGRSEVPGDRLDEALTLAPPPHDLHLRAVSAARWGVVARVLGREAVADQLLGEAERLAPETGAVASGSELGHWIARLREAR